MKSIVRVGWIAGLLLFAAQGLAEDQIPWVADFRTACGMAAEQRRLVLLHFYSDNCGPCVRLEQNVFNKPEVGEAVAQNYLAVKVHAGKNVQLASRYRVNQWPTDVFVTPSGLEVYRTISPREAPDYVALLNQVAQQTGVGAGRQWKNQVAQASQQASAGLQATAGQAQNGLKSAASQFQMAADQARAARSHVGAEIQQTQQQVHATIDRTNQQTAEAVGQATSTARQWSQQAQNAVERQEQQAGDAYRGFREQTNQVGQQVQNQAQNDVEAAKQQWRSTGRMATEEVGQTVENLKNHWQQGPASSLLERRSAFVPAEPSPATAAAANTSGLAPPLLAAQGVPSAASPPATTAPNQVLLPTENPWVTSPQVEKKNAEIPAVANNSPKLESQAAPPDAAAPALAMAPPFIPARPEPQVQPAAAPPALVQPTPSAPALVQQRAAMPNLAPMQADSSPNLVPASQAPPLVLDGFCPVTLMEAMAKNPTDRAAWRKGDRKFGAIHRGRTYLFATPEAQQRFLANPDAFAPVLAGCDPVRFAERGEMVDGKRAYGLLTTDKRMVLFADEAARDRFEQSPGSFTLAIQQAMLRSESGNLYR